MNKESTFLSHFPVEKILQASLSKGGSFADLFHESTKTTTIVCDDKKIQSIETGIDNGMALRVIADLKTAFGYTNELTEDYLLSVAEGLAGSIRDRAFNRSIKLKKIRALLSFPVQQDPTVVSFDDKIKQIRAIEKLAWSLSPDLVQVRVRYGDVIRHVEISNSDGESVDFSTTLVNFAVRVTASNGREYFRGYETLGGHLGYELFDSDRLRKVAETAVNRALLNMRAKKARGGTMPVIISSSSGGTLVHEAVGHGLEADLACQGLSIYEGKLGKKIASPLVTVIDDPTLPQKRGSYAFDDEGVASQKTVLIEKGVLKTFLFDRLTAMKMGNKSNGHGRRESYEYRPIVRMANTMIAPGKEDPEKIIQSVQNGLLVKMMGGGQVDTVNGDFMFEVTEGYRIENGKIGEPVRGATLTGSGPEILQKIDRVGNDLGFSIGTCGKDGQDAPVSDAMPTIRIPEMVVGGIVQ